MSHWTIESARPETLHETVALLPDPADAARRLGIIQGNVAAGRLNPEQFHTSSEEFRRMFRNCSDRRE
ncbi:hypothetical protein [Deinococcus arcticus]|uniref:Uncharacterized protein n=1 Tax=Deinococcus arcticus TaxID=2136176 RepID=A0A2T3W969_9DEIO|nr:hypothetical protein [Deinococcus arcticus]PTA68432.1 hypothetical protein C8263_08380 [Deinococcus arcticus]